MPSLKGRRVRDVTTNTRKTYCRPSYELGPEIEGLLANHTRMLCTIGFSDNKIRNSEKYVRHCIKLLGREFGTVDIHSMGPETMEELSNLMGVLKDNSRDRYLIAFARFLNDVNHTSIPTFKPRESKRADMESYVRNLSEGAPYKDELAKWIDRMVLRGLRDNTMRNNIKSTIICLRILEDAFGHIPLEDVGEEEMFLLRAILLKGRGESTVQVYLRTTGLFIKFVTGRNPYHESAFLWNDDSSVRRTFIFEPEWRKLRDLSDETDRVILALGGGMGLRRSEIAGIKISDIHGSELTIRGKGHGEYGKVCMMQIPAGVMRAIMDYIPIRHRILEHAGGDWSEDNLLVSDSVRRGTPFTPDQVADRISRLAKRAGLKASTHCLRRLYATTLSDGGMDVYTLSQMMRHSDISTVTRCYLRPDPRKISQGMKTIGDSLFV